MSEVADNSRAKMRAFFSPIILVVIIAIVLSGITLSFYGNPETQDIPDDISPYPENPDDPGGIAQGAIMNMLFYVAIVFISGFVRIC